MKRRDFLKTLTSSAAALPFIQAALVERIAAGAATADRKSDKPNIILFITDDQDRLSIGAYGGKSMSPNLDRLAREGMVFHRAATPDVLTAGDTKTSGPPEGRDFLRSTSSSSRTI